MKGFLDANGESVFDLMENILSPSGDDGETKENPMEVRYLYSLRSSTAHPDRAAVHRGLLTGFPGQAFFYLREHQCLVGASHCSQLPTSS